MLLVLRYLHGSDGITGRLQQRLHAFLCGPDDLGGSIAHHWLASNTISGIKVVAPPGFPQGTRLEFVNDRTYVVSLEAEFVNFSAKNLVAFTETISQQGGGGQRLVTLETRYDLPVVQRVSRYTPIRLVQQGMAVGAVRLAELSGSGVAGLPERCRDTIMRSGPHLRGVNYENYQIQWTYVMNVAGSGSSLSQQGPANLGCVMATVRWRGDAAAIAQVQTITPASIGIGNTFTVTQRGRP